MAKSANTITKAPGMAMQFVREARDELKKVSWPDRETTIQYTVAVVVGSLVMSGIVALADYILSLVLETFIL